MEAGIMAKIVQIAADLSYDAGVRDGLAMHAHDNAAPAVAEVLRRLYVVPSKTSYGNGQRVALRRVAEAFGVRLDEAQDASSEQQMNDHCEPESTNVRAPQSQWEDQ